MERKLFLLLFYCLLFGSPIFAQCIPSDSLWKRLIYIRDSSTSSANESLQEMLNYQRRLEKCHIKNDTSYALLLQRIGAAYNTTGDYLQAEKYVNKAIQTINHLPGELPVNESQLIRSYYLLSLVYEGLNNTSDKIKAIDSVIEISVRTNSKDTRVLKSLVIKVEYLFYIGDYQRVISFANEGEILTSRLITSDDRKTYLFYFLIWKVNSLVFLEKFNEAEKLINENIALYPAGSPNNSHAVILERMAAIKTKTGNYSEAETFFNKSLQYNMQHNNNLECMLTFVNMGYYLYEQGLNSPSKAIHCYQKALYFASKIYLKPNNTDSTAAVVESFNIYNNIANVYEKKDQFDSAQYYFQRGLKRLNIKYSSENLANLMNNEFLENKSIPALINALTDQGISYLNQYKRTKDRNFLNKSSTLYSTADRLQQIIKNEQKEIQSQLYWRSNLRKLYGNAIETAYLVGNIDMAFDYFEKSRTVLLTDQLTRQLSLTRDDILKVGLIRTKIAELNRTLNNYSPSSEEYKQIHLELFAYASDLSVLDQQIQKHNPTYLKAIEDTTTISLKEVQQKVLKDHSALLELFVGDSVVFSLLITQTGIYLNRINKLEYEKMSAEFLSYMSNLSLLNSQFENFLKTAKHLYDLIFNQLPIPDGRIIISPDGKYFPYEALVASYQNIKPTFFITNHAVSYTYSARYLLYNISINSGDSKSKDFLGVAPVGFLNFNLPDLPGSAESLKRIEKLYSSTTSLVSEHATKNGFLNNFPEYNIIQLYTHSSDTSSAGEPVIYFSDSTIYLSDLVTRERPSSQLIVLSACETGNGRLFRGEGVFSFNRGFASLGIPATITNLWSVDNESTYALTEIFYKYLSEKMPIDIALQKAKLEFIRNSSKQKKLPYYWAAAILVGKTDAIEMSNHFNWTLIAVGGGLFIVAIFFALIKRKNKTPVS